jgi:hypothetical protein
MGVMGVERQCPGSVVRDGDLGGDGGTGRTEEGADRGVDLAVGGLEEELGLGGIHAAGHLAELGDLVVHGCRHVGRERSLASGFVSEAGDSAAK